MESQDYPIGKYYSASTLHTMHDRLMARDLAYSTSTYLREERDTQISPISTAPTLDSVMAFQLTSMSIEMRGSILTAECLTMDGSWKSSSIDLNHYLGNIDGSFNADFTNFYATATSVCVRGSVLTAYLLRCDGTYKPAAFELGGYVANMNGQLQFHKPHGFPQIYGTVNVNIVNISIMSASATVHDSQTTTYHITD